MNPIVVSKISIIIGMFTNKINLLRLKIQGHMQKGEDLNSGY